MVLGCGCKGVGGTTKAAEQQDAMYGVGQRAHNPTTKENTFRCTVCGTERTGPSKKEKGAEVDPKEKKKKK